MLVLNQYDLVVLCYFVNNLYQEENPFDTKERFDVSALRRQSASMACCRGRREEENLFKS